MLCVATAICEGRLRYYLNVVKISQKTCDITPARESQITRLHRIFVF